MKNIPIIDIIFEPSERVRQEGRTPEGKLSVESLKQSLQHFGQLVPILVQPLPDNKWKLIDGERRLTAAKRLKWSHVAAIERDASPEEMEALEIITTIEREAFAWQEEVRSKARLHELMCSLFGRSTADLKIPGGWTIDQTAKVLGQHKATLSRELQLARALDTVPELTEKTSKSSALKYLKRSGDFALREELAKGMSAEPNWTVHEGHCVEVMKAQLADESVDLILTDPPFGILDDNDMSWRDWRQGGSVYKDGAALYVELMHAFAKEAYRVLKPGRHLYVFCGWEWIVPLKGWLTEAGFVCPGPPAVWHRRGRVKYTHMDRFATDYYSIVFAAKPYEDAKQFKWQEMSRFQNACILGIDPVMVSRAHPAEAPVELFDLFVRLSSVPGELVLDAFCGSGASGEAVLSNKRRYIGIDIDHNWINLTRLKLSALEQR